MTVDGTGIGAGGVTVAVYDDASETKVAETKTAGLGDFHFRSSSLPDGAYRLRVGDEWYPDASDWAGADTLVLSAGAPTVVDVSVPAVASMSGTVVDWDGKPLDRIALVAVTAPGGDAVALVWSRDDGTFTLPVTEAGAFDLYLFDRAGQWAPTGLDGGPVELTTGDRSVGTIDISSGAPYDPATTVRVSVNSHGSQGLYWSYAPSTSGDGRYVAFESEAENLVPGDSNLDNDVFVRDVVARTTIRASVANDGSQGNANSLRPSISSDGRYVAFSSAASNLVPDDTNGSIDVFVRDVVAGTTTRVSVAGDGTEGDRGSDGPEITADGRYVTFYSYASNLVPGDSNGTADVFVRDRMTGTTTRVSVAGDGEEGDGNSTNTSISDDGRYVAFYSYASNLVPGDTNGTGDVFVRDLTAGTTTRVSVAADGTEGNGQATLPSISADGSVVAFTSDASNLVTDDVNSAPDVFVRNLDSGTLVLASVDSNGTHGNGPAYSPSISADGSVVAFTSLASNLVPGDTGWYSDVFVHDLTSGRTTRASVDSHEVQVQGGSSDPSISADGRAVAFSSASKDLVAGDTNTVTDVFLRSPLRA
ncbi:MAG: PD40 domain-containing protein [Acidimicrobiales bacterium]|nr:PD40 domain-containing protein [Acidimicrobiales bacterium]